MPMTSRLYYFLPFSAPPEKRATLRATLQRQFCVVPPPAQGVDPKDKTAIMTGSSGGIDPEFTRQLLDLGLTRLILAVSNVQRGQQVKITLSSGCQLADDAINVWEMDLFFSLTAFSVNAEGSVKGP
ncbi:hypothetical protein HD806DRAFT_521320 [Xylariaceae sp. AK1471]|nr:hypothetical protein HD806DRAFT_521320 [Xylariaceae sp. AK1471]